MRIRGSLPSATRSPLMVVIVFATFLLRLESAVPSSLPQRRKEARTEYRLVALSEQHARIRGRHERGSRDGRGSRQVQASFNIHILLFAPGPMALLLTADSPVPFEILADAGLQRETTMPLALTISPTVLSQ